MSEDDRTLEVEKWGIPKYQKGLLSLEPDLTLPVEQADISRRALCFLALNPLETCTSREDLAERFRRAEPPFGEFLEYAEKYLS